MKFLTTLKGYLLDGMNYLIKVSKGHHLLSSNQLMKMIMTGY